VIENVMHLGGATVGAIRDMVTLAVRLEEFTKKYHLGTVESKERKEITEMLERVEKINGSDASHIKLKPVRDLSIESGESEEEIAERMMRLDVRDDDGDDEDWIKLYSTYVKRKDEGNLDETPLQVS
jgi:DNA-directed RNA polymerase beta' subunit